MTKFIICDNEIIEADSLEGKIIQLIVNGVQNEDGSRIEFESVPILNDDGPRFEIKINGSLARIRNNIVQELSINYWQYTKEELEQLVLLLMRKSITAMPPLKLPEEFELLELLAKDTPPIKSIQVKTTVYK